MFPMVKRPYGIYIPDNMSSVRGTTACPRWNPSPIRVRAGCRWRTCNNAIDYIDFVVVVAKCGVTQYSSDAVSDPGAVCAFCVSGRATLRMNGNYFKCLVHRKEDGSLWIEPVNKRLCSRITTLTIFGPNTKTARTGACAKHGINYSEFTTADAEMIRMAIDRYFHLYLSPKAEAVAAH